MKIKWIKREETVEKIAARLDLPIVGRSSGRDSEYNEFIELDIKADKITGPELKLLNEQFPGYTRDTSVVPFDPAEKRDLEAEMDDLVRRVDELVRPISRG